MTTTRTLPAALAGFLLALPVVAQDSTPKHLLRYRFQKGSVRHFNVAQKAEIKMTFGEQSIDTPMSMEMFMQFEITDVANGLAQVETKINRVKVKMSHPMSGEIEFDTSDEASIPAMFDSMVDVVGQTIEFSLNDRGQTKSVKVPDAMKKVAPTGIDVEHMVAQIVAPLPETPVAIGDTWQTTMSQKMGQAGKVALDVENKLLAIKGDDAIIGMNMKIDLDGPAMPQEINVEEAKAEVTMDMSQGLPKGMKTSMKLGVTMEQNGMTMNMKMKTEMTVKPIAPPAPEKGEKK